MQLQFESDMDIAVRAYRKALSELTEAERKRDSIIAGMKTEAGSYKGFRDSLVDKLKAIEQQRGHELAPLAFFTPSGRETTSMPWISRLSRRLSSSMMSFSPATCCW